MWQKLSHNQQIVVTTVVTNPTQHPFGLVAANKNSVDCQHHTTAKKHASKQFWLCGNILSVVIFWQSI